MHNLHLGWYLAYTKPRQERVAKEHLERQGFHIYLPFLKYHKRIKMVYQIITEPLFPRYLFIQISSELDDWSKIRSTRGCLNLVRFSTYPARVPDLFIEQLKSHITERYNQQKATTSDFKPGNNVQILEGLLEGYEGIIQSKDHRQRVTILLKIAEGHTSRISYSVHQIKKIG